MQDVGDVAVDEDIAGLEAEEGSLRDAGVTAADPKDGRVLSLCALGEEVGVLVGDGLGPGGVAVQVGLEFVVV